MNGGIGTAFRNLAYKLSATHNVTILFTLGPESMPGSAKNWSEWQEEYATRNVLLLAVPSPLTYVAEAATVTTQRSHEAYLWIKERESQFDVVHFPEWQGAGFFTTQAKKMGLCCSRLTLVVQTHSPSLWALEGNAAVVDDRGQLEADFLERRSAEQADVVISPSLYMLDWVTQHGWQLPPHSFYHPNAAFVAVHVEPLVPRSIQPSCLPPQLELVFFGRLEKRKGLFLFIEALRHLAIAGLLGSELNVTLLGKLPEPNRALHVALANLTLAAAYANTTLHVEQDSLLNSEQATCFLLARPCAVAIMPSLMENLPYTVAEALTLKLPFLASNVGGVRELLHPDDTEAATFAPTVHGLRERLARLFSEGARQWRPNPNVHTVDSVWNAWHSSVQPPMQLTAVREGRTENVTVVMTTYNQRPVLLKAAIASLEAQDFPAERLEVVLVDDGSSNALSLSCLAELKPRLEAKGWKLIRIPNSYLGAARNIGVAASRGQLLMCV